MCEHMLKRFSVSTLEPVKYWIRGENHVCRFAMGDGRIQVLTILLLVHREKGKRVDRYTLAK